MSEFKDRGLRVYVSSPYYHADKQTMKDRSDRVRMFVRWLTDQISPGLAVFYSPILYTRNLGLESLGDSYWNDVEQTTVPMYDALWEYCLPGYEDSAGMKRERIIALREGMPVWQILPGSINRLDLTETITEQMGAVNCGEDHYFKGFSIVPEGEGK